MTRLNVNPTRMELRRLKTRLATATRGHKLLKDKSDEMIRVFSLKLRENKRLREETEAELAEVFRKFSMAGSNAPAAALTAAFSMPGGTTAVECSRDSVMGVEVPKLEVSGTPGKDALPYSFASVTSEADDSVRRVGALLPKMIELAELEHSVKILADEIEKNKRRVNALEYVMIPQLEETIRYIRIKLDENERGNLARLMKVKSMLAKD